LNTKIFSTSLFKELVQNKVNFTLKKERKIKTFVIFLMIKLYSLPVSLLIIFVDDTIASGETQTPRSYRGRREQSKCSIHETL
jgi:hypothetical protein